MRKKSKILNMLIIIFISTICFADYNSLKPIGSTKIIFDFADQAKSLSYILIPTKPTSLEQQAAKEFKKDLEKISGAKFDIVKRKKTTSLPFISIGRTDALREVGISPDKENLKEEGYGIQIKEGNLFLFGAAHWGPLFAVSALLEEDIGCRWYTHRWSKIPKKEKLSVEITSRISTPAFRVRDAFSWINNTVPWTWQNRVRNINSRNHLKGHLRYVKGWWCHTYDKLFPRHRFNERRDLFMVGVDGKKSQNQLCPSNPEVIRMAEEKILEALKSNKIPEASFISLSQGDHPCYCHCKDCRKINAAEKTPLAAHMKLVNHIARIIKKTYPNVRITFLAYHHTLKPPKSLSLEDNVMVRVCTTFDDEKNTKHPHLRPISKHPIFMRNLKEWNKRAKAISVWDYQVDFLNYLRPWPTIYAMSQNIKIFNRYNVVSIMIQGAFQSPGADRQGMRAWVLTKLMWNPNLDVKDLIKDYIYGVYSKSAPAMMEYNDLIFKAGEAGKPIEEFYGRKNFISKANKIFSQAKKLSRGDRETLKRIDLARLPVIDMELLALKKSYENDKVSINFEKYKKLLKEFESICAANKVKQYSERNSTKIKILERNLFLANLKKSSGITGATGAIWADDVGLRVGERYGAKIVQDPLASNGYAVHQPSKTGAWSFQWWLPYERFNHAKKYQLYIKCRIDKTADIGQGLEVGVYDLTTRKCIFRTFVKASMLSKNKYETYKIGKAFIVPPKAYVWIAPPTNNKKNVQAVYTDRVDLVPEKIQTFSK
jgi:hypothetical protein